MSDRLARFVLTLLHVLTAMAAAGCLLSVLVDWEQVNQNDCSPVNGTESYTLSHTCSAMEYGDGILSGLSLLMAVGINCFWGRWGCSCLNQWITQLICLTSLGIGVSLSGAFLDWCHDLETEYPIHSLCAEAASAYDKQTSKSTMMAYYRKMVLQQGFQWAVVALSLFTLAVYTVVMKKQGNAIPLVEVMHYHTTPTDEGAPLLGSTNRHPPSRSSSRTSGESRSRGVGARGNITRRFFSGGAADDMETSLVNSSESDRDQTTPKTQEYPSST